MRLRILLAILAVAVTAPAVVSAGALAFALIPILNVGIAPFLGFVLAANGVAGLFAFLYLFGAPVAAIICALAYAGMVTWLRSGRAITTPWRIFAGAALGAVVLPPIWIAFPTNGSVLPYVGPALLGAVTGCAANAIFWVVASSARSLQGAA